MGTRDKEVLNMQFTLIPVLAKAWNKSYSDLSDMFTKYDVPGYIDVCYEKYNSTGNQGIIDDLQEYIEMQGGSIEQSYDYAIVDSYGLKDPGHLVRSIPDSEVIRLVARTEDRVPDHVLSFISEHSGKADVHAELEDTFYTVWMGKWGVYSVQHDESRVSTDEYILRGF